MTSWRCAPHLFVLLISIYLSKQDEGSSCSVNYFRKEDLREYLMFDVQVVITKNPKDTIECTLEKACRDRKDLAHFLIHCYKRDENWADMPLTEKCKGNSSQTVSLHHIICMVAKENSLPLEHKVCEYDVVFNLSQDILHSGAVDPGKHMDHTKLPPPPTTTLPTATSPTAATQPKRKTTTPLLPPLPTTTLPTTTTLRKRKTTTPALPSGSPAEMFITETKSSVSSNTDLVTGAETAKPFIILPVGLLVISLLAILFFMHRQRRLRTSGETHRSYSGPVESHEISDSEHPSVVPHSSNPEV